MFIYASDIGPITTSVSVNTSPGGSPFQRRRSPSVLSNSSTNVSSIGDGKASKAETTLKTTSTTSSSNETNTTAENVTVVTKPNASDASELGGNLPTSVSVTNQISTRDSSATSNLSLVNDPSTTSLVVSISTETKPATASVKPATASAPVPLPRPMSSPPSAQTPPRPSSPDPPLLFQPQWRSSSSKTSALGFHTSPSKEKTTAPLLGSRLSSWVSNASKDLSNQFSGTDKSPEKNLTGISGLGSSLKSQAKATPNLPSPLRAASSLPVTTSANISSTAIYNPTPAHPVSTTIVSTSVDSTLGAPVTALSSVDALVSDTIVQSSINASAGDPSIQSNFNREATSSLFSAFASQNSFISPVTVSSLPSSSNAGGHNFITSSINANPLSRSGSPLIPFGSVEMPLPDNPETVGLMTDSVESLSPSDFFPSPAPCEGQAPIAPVSQPVCSFSLFSSTRVTNQPSSSVMSTSGSTSTSYKTANSFFSSTPSPSFPNAPSSLPSGPSSLPDNVPPAPFPSFPETSSLLDAQSSLLRVLSSLPNAPSSLPDVSANLPESSSSSFPTVPSSAPSFYASEPSAPTRITDSVVDTAIITSLSSSLARPQSSQTNDSSEVYLSDDDDSAPLPSRDINSGEAIVWDLGEKIIEAALMRYPKLADQDARTVLEAIKQNCGPDVMENDFETTLNLFAAFANDMFPGFTMGEDCAVVAYSAQVCTF